MRLCRLPWGKPPASGKPTILSAAAPPEAKPLFLTGVRKAGGFPHGKRHSRKNSDQPFPAQTFLTSQVSSVYFWPSIKNRSFENPVEARPPKVNSFALDEGLEVVERGRSPKLAVAPSLTVGWLLRLNPQDCHRKSVESYDN
jgi:hypothetical protein